MVVAPRYDDYPEAFDTNVRRAIPVMSAHPEVAYFHCYRDGVDWVFVDHAAFRSVKHAIHSGDWCGSQAKRARAGSEVSPKGGGFGVASLSGLRKLEGVQCARSMVAF